MKNFAPHTLRGRLLGAGIALAAVAGIAGFGLTAENEESAAAPQAVAVSVATVDEREAAGWDEFSGRLEAVERVEIRPRVAGVVQDVHFREGSLVRKGDLLFTIDRAPYAAEVQRAEAQLASARSSYAFAKVDLDRARQLVSKGTISKRTLDERVNIFGEAEAALHGAEANLEATRLNLEYTEIRAPISGRVGKAEITTGNLVAAGPGAPVLTTLVSVSPIYASFNADERVVARALNGLAGADARTQVGQIPVQMGTSATDGTPFRGHLQLIDNQVDALSGTVRVRAVFDNEDGTLIPGQFARLRMGQAQSRPVIAITERAVGIDQDKKFVLVVEEDNHVAYREVTLGESFGALREVTHGLAAGERIVVNGLQRVRPGDLIEPQSASMEYPAQVAEAGNGRTATR
ncbi:efflux transporter, RND family, MFP subunit [Parvibaculum lavamentivorans DS-1]|uniref:Efflux transporter, RND family, MFP subunit n=1 Tax=Parvibaculum lavamentivorans (strain DS-1 / DSM 13023 / NCIMB 13966) TaxID=402881 RepID=A7HR05_PARL1|nr:efflux RND transporter periplasmic adaptor subunit [Parvibaculum lavamentivorans]ABS62338.1 efflux transporter, RND family, MFP subunit [Parvibaculum lavamentivorans DS-1]